MGLAIEPKHQWSEEQLLSMPHIGKAELIDGRFIVAPAGSEHGGISALLGAYLLMHVRRHKLGIVFDSSTGFWMNNEDLLSPDVAFVAAARLKGMKKLPRKYFRGSPDLVAEVLSPNDRAAEMDRKLDDYFANGTRLAWIVDPAEKTVRVYTSRQASHLLTNADTLDGSSLVPGFTLPLAELFAVPDFD